MKKLILTLVCAVLLAPVSFATKTVTVNTPVGSVSYQDDGYTDARGWFHPYGHYCEHCHRQHVKAAKKAHKKARKAAKKHRKQVQKARKQAAKHHHHAH